MNVCIIIAVFSVITFVKCANEPQHGKIASRLSEIIHPRRVQQHHRREALSESKRKRCEFCRESKRCKSEGRCGLCNILCKDVDATPYSEAPTVGNVHDLTTAPNAMRNSIEKSNIDSGSYYTGSTEPTVAYKLKNPLIVDSANLSKSIQKDAEIITLDKINNDQSDLMNKIDQELKIASEEKKRLLNDGELTKEEINKVVNHARSSEYRKDPSTAIHLQSRSIADDSNGLSDNQQDSLAQNLGKSSKGLRQRLEDEPSDDIVQLRHEVNSDSKSGVQDMPKLTTSNDITPEQFRWFLQNVEQKIETIAELVKKTCGQPSYDEIPNKKIVKNKILPPIQAEENPNREMQKANQLLNTRIVNPEGGESDIKDFNEVENFGNNDNTNTNVQSHSGDSKEILGNVQNDNLETNNSPDSLLSRSWIQDNSEPRPWTIDEEKNQEVPQQTLVNGNSEILNNGRGEPKDTAREPYVSEYNQSVVPANPEGTSSQQTDNAIAPSYIKNEEINSADHHSPNIEIEDDDKPNFHKNTNNEENIYYVAPTESSIMHKDLNPANHVEVDKEPKHESGFEFEKPKSDKAVHKDFKKNPEGRNPLMNPFSSPSNLPNVGRLINAALSDQANNGEPEPVPVNEPSNSNQGVDANNQSVDNNSPRNNEVGDSSISSLQSVPTKNESDDTDSFNNIDTVNTNTNTRPSEKNFDNIDNLSRNGDLSDTSVPALKSIPERSETDGVNETDNVNSVDIKSIPKVNTNAGTKSIAEDFDNLAQSGDLTGSSIPPSQSIHNIDTNEHGNSNHDQLLKNIDLSDTKTPSLESIPALDKNKGVLSNDDIIENANNLNGENSPSLYDKSEDKGVVDYYNNNNKDIPSVEQRFANEEVATETSVVLNNQLQDSTKTYGMNGKIIPQESSNSENVIFVSNGMQLPFNMKKHSDGTYHLSMDMEKLCYSCNNEKKMSLLNLNHNNAMKDQSHIMRRRDLRMGDYVHPTYYTNVHKKRKPLPTKYKKLKKISKRSYRSIKSLTEQNSTKNNKIVKEKPKLNGLRNENGTNNDEIKLAIERIKLVNNVFGWLQGFVNPRVN